MLPVPLRRCFWGPWDRLCLAEGHCTCRRERILRQLLLDPPKMSCPKLMLIHSSLLLKETGRINEDMM